MSNLYDILWTEKYRPKTVAGCILPNSLKNAFQEFVIKRAIPNLLLTGRAGVGKTSVAKAMLDEIGADYITINGSMNGNIDTLRVDISQFASTMSFNGERKYVILDEADYLNPNSTQPALRNFMEEFSKNCGFILTCNFKNKIIDPLHSRCSVIDFTIPPSEKPRMATLFMKRLKTILDQENVTYKDNVIAEFIKKHFPDWRRILNELQRYSSNSERVVDTGILALHSEENYKQLFEYMKTKSFTNIRKWVAENSGIETSEMFRHLYDSAQSFLKPQSIPQLVLILGEYQFKAAFVADPEINIVACLTNVMIDCEFV